MDKLSKIQEDIFAGLESFDILKDLSKEDQLTLATNVCKQLASEIDAITSGSGDLPKEDALNGMKDHIVKVGLFLDNVPNEIAFLGIKNEIKTTRIIQANLDLDWVDLMNKLTEFIVKFNLDNRPNWNLNDLLIRVNETNDKVIETK